MHMLLGGWVGGRTWSKKNRGLWRDIGDIEMAWVDQEQRGVKKERHGWICRCLLQK